MRISRRALFGLLAVSPAALFLKNDVVRPAMPGMGDGWMTADVRVLASDLARCPRGSVGIPGIVRRVHALVLGEERSGTRFAKRGVETHISFFGKDGRPWGEAVSPEFQGNVTLPSSTLAEGRRFDMIDRSARIVRKTLVQEAVRLDTGDRLPFSKRELTERLNAELGWVRVEMKLAA